MSDNEKSADEMSTLLAEVNSVLTQLETTKSVDIDSTVLKGKITEIKRRILKATTVEEFNAIVIDAKNYFQKIHRQCS